MKIGLKQEVILGPPGTGKTTTLIRKVQEYIDAGIQPEEIAFVSFTRKAVGEAADRACERFNIRRSKFPLFQTVHSLCFRQLGIGKDAMLGRADYIALGEWLGYDLSGQYDMGDGVIQSGAAPGDKFLFIDQLARVQMRSVREVWEDQSDDIPWHEQERFSAGYARFRERKGLLDFTDLLTKYIAEGRPTKPKVAFIDEAQDLSRAQWHVLQKCFGEVPEVFIAGDDDQSIYKWSGADLETFLSLEGEKTVLTQSYRLPVLIHERAVGTIKQIKKRFKKEFAPKPEDGVIEHVSELEQIDIKEDESTLILARNVFLLPSIYEYLQQQGLTYTGRNGMQSVKASHVHAIVAWERMRKGEALTLDEVKVMYEHLRVGETIKRGSKTKLEEEGETGEKYSYETLRDHFGLVQKPIWHEALAGIPLESREYYTAVLRSKRKITAQPLIHVNTIHGSKGGEASHVVILSDMSKRTYMEMQKDYDSEVRVAYVALTRAKSRITIVLPRGKFSFPY